MSMDVETLISAVQERRSLWDQSHKKYHDRDFTSKLWKEVARECNSTEVQVKKKWKHLRDNFRAELKKNAPGHSGDGKTPTKALWKWFNMMMFLRGTMALRKLEANLVSHNMNLSRRELSVDVEADEFSDQSASNIEGTSVETESQISETSQASASFAVPRRRNTPKCRPYEESINEREKLQLVRSLTQDQAAQDSTYHFLMSLRDPINRLPLNKQMQVRCRFQEILAQVMNANPIQPLTPPPRESVNELETFTYHEVEDANTFICKIEQPRDN